MSTISGLGGANRSWDSAQQTRKAEHDARMFAKVDSDGSGGVDATELAQMLKQGNATGDADSAALLKQMDSDGDGSLSSDELSQGMRDLMPPPASTLDFAQARAGSGDEEDGDADSFAALDTDGDGQLSRAEFEAARPQQGPQGPQGAGGPPPAQSGGTQATSASSSTSYDPLDTNQDGTVSEIERLAGQLKELAKAGADADGQGATSDIAVLAQKLYDQISKNWLQPAAQTQGVDTSA
ncbi:XopAW family type III secretion system calcium-binding effector [Roseateles sp.]|uniref:XopAW family type III secretion system calcium-binding effector n=1 Tax=Roseateles sp. TaxID=1971397 RepID=UPI0039E99A72